MNIFFKQPKKTTILLGVLMASFGLISLASAQTTWTPPTALPPDGNTLPPVNVSVNSQDKRARLGLYVLSTVSNIFELLGINLAGYSDGGTTLVKNFILSGNSGINQALHLFGNGTTPATRNVKIWNNLNVVGTTTTENLVVNNYTRLSPNTEICTTAGSCTTIGGGLWSNSVAPNAIYYNKGWVGVGVAVPNSQLDVAGNILVSSGTTGTSYRNDRIQRTTADSFLALSGGASADRGAAILLNGENRPTYNGRIDLNTSRGDKTSNLNRLTISGNVDTAEVQITNANLTANGGVKFSTLPLQTAYPRVLVSDANGNLGYTTDFAGGSLPTGVTTQTLRHNGTDWVANSAISNDGSGNVTFNVIETLMNGFANIVGSLGVVGDSHLMGKVGVGTTNPGAKLHVQTSDVVQTADVSADDLLVESNGATGLTILSATNNTGSILFGDSGSANVGGIIYNHNGNYLAFKNNGSERMRLTSTGLVGIGTSNPTELLQVGNSTYNNSAIVNVDSAANKMAGLRISSAGVPQWNIYKPADGSNDLWFEDAGSAKALKLTQAGQVFLPAVTQANPNNRVVTISNTGALGWENFTDMTGGGGSLWTQGTGDNIYRSLGNVGIGGGTTPLNSLDVAGTGVRVTGWFNETTTNKGLYLGINTQDNTPRVMFANGTPSQSWQIDNLSGTFRWYLPGKTYMTLSATGGLALPNSTSGVVKASGSGTNYFLGKMGIGIAIPSAQLHTTGTVRLAGLPEQSAYLQAVVRDTNGNLGWKALAEIAGGGSLPSGTSNQTLRHNGTTWVGASNLTNDGTLVTTAGLLVTGTAGINDLSANTFKLNKFEPEAYPPASNYYKVMISDANGNATWASILHMPGLAKQAEAGLSSDRLVVMDGFGNLGWKEASRLRAYFSKNVSGSGFTLSPNSDAGFTYLVQENFGSPDYMEMVCPANYVVVSGGANCVNNANLQTSWSPSNNNWVVSCGDQLANIVSTSIVCARN